MTGRITAALLALILGAAVACSSNSIAQVPDTPKTATWPADFTGKRPPPRTVIATGVRDCGEDLRLLSNPSYAAAECLGTAFQQCTSATARVDGYTIEGDWIASDYTVVRAGAGCAVRVHTHSDDKFGQKGDFDATCASMTAAPSSYATWVLGGCDGSEWAMTTI